MSKGQSKCLRISLCCSVLLAAAAGCFLFFCGGCSEMAVWGDAAEFVTPEGPPDFNETFDWYEFVQLRQSSSADVLSLIYLPNYELLSQSKSVIAVTGEKKQKDFKAWFKMVGFDENDMMVRRKYLFIEDERPKVILKSPQENANFDCQMVIDSEVLNKPYANNNAKQIAILKYVLESFRKDAREVRLDNKRFSLLSMMVNQALENALTHIQASPALVQRLIEPAGVKLPHPNMGRSQVRMLVEDDIVKVHIHSGSSAKKFDDIKEETAEEQPKEI